MLAHHGRFGGNGPVAVERCGVAAFDADRDCSAAHLNLDAPVATAASTPTGAPVPVISLLPASGRVGVMVTVTGAAGAE